MRDQETVLFGRDRAIFLAHVTNQLDWLWIKGKLAVDYVGQLEEIDETYLYLSRKFSLPETLSHDNSSGAYETYRDAYDGRSWNLVAEWHAKDLVYFGYEF